MIKSRLGVLLAPLLLLAAGCAGTETAPVGTAGQPGESDAGFPATVQTVNGAVTVEQRPQRVVLLNDQLVETAAALGINPAAAPTPTTPLGPWADEAIDQTTAAFSLPMADGVPLEAVAASDPDLIVLHDYQATGQIYDQLSELAPTVVLPLNAEAPAPPTWENDLRAIGTATGRSAEADRVAATIETQIETITDDHPQIAGASYQLGNFLSSSEFVCTNSDGTSSARFLGSLGLELGRIPGAGSDARAVVSKENFSALNDIDLVIMGASDDQLAQKLRDDPVFSQLQPVRNETAHLVDLTWVTAYNIPTALSIPFLLEDLEPSLERL